MCYTMRYKQVTETSRAAATGPTSSPADKMEVRNPQAAQADTRPGGTSAYERFLASMRHKLSLSSGKRKDTEQA